MLVLVYYILLSRLTKKKAKAKKKRASSDESWLKKVEKSKDGVPIWDGDSSSYQEYEEMALLWEQSIATHKRYLCAPRLITELTGSARRFTIGRHPEWVSYNGGGLDKPLLEMKEKLQEPKDKTQKKEL
eukprot:symbB.v1.2.040718.t1/scaffold7466.1/size11101/1